MKRKIRFMTCIVLLIFMTSNVYAAMPDGTVVIGNKAFSLDYANDEKNSDIIGNIVSSMKGDDKVFIKTDMGEWYDNEGKSINKSEIPGVEYRTESGEYVEYSAADKDKTKEEGYRVLDVSFMDRETMKITFSEPIALMGDYSKMISLGGYIKAKSFKRNQTGNVIIIELEEEIVTKKYIVDIEISSELSSENNEKLKMDYEERVIAINKEVIENEIFTDKISIITHGFKGEKLKFLKGVTFTGDSVTLEDIEATEVVVDPGDNGQINLKNIKTDSVIILSGGENSIHIEESNIKNMIVNTGKKVRVIAEKGTSIEKSTIESDAILESDGGHFYNVFLPDCTYKKTVEILSEIMMLEAGNNSNIITREQGVIKKLQIKNNVFFTGFAEEVLGNAYDGELTIGDGSKIKILRLLNISKVNIEGFIDLGEVEGTDEQVERIEKMVKEAEEIQDINESSWAYYTDEVEKIEMYSKTRANTKYFNGISYKCVVITFDFNEFEVSDKEFEKGILVWIKDEKGNVCDVQTLEIPRVDKKVKMKFFVKNNTKARVILETYKEGIITFDMKY